MNNFLLWIGGLLVVLLCALFAVPHFIDWNGYRGAFEEEASRILGREVRVAGRVNLRILPTPFVRFEKVRLSDVEGVTGEPFFRADDFTLWLAPGALLRGTLEANRVELHRPILKLRLNANGSGNWQTFSLNNGALPFVLSDAALQTVNLSDGAVSVDGPDGTELARIDSIGGDVTASTLTGPFRFRGQANWNEEARALRLSTAAPEPDGTTRFKLNVAVPKSGNTYAFDGAIVDRMGKPQIDGTLSGTLRIADVVTPNVSGTPQTALVPPPLELTAQVTGNTDGIKLTDVSLAFDQDSGKPQSLTGTIEARIVGNPGLSANLSSRWLDVDRVLGLDPTILRTAAKAANSPAVGTVPPNSGYSSPLMLLRQMSVGLASVMPSTMPASVTIAAEAVSLAGDNVNSVRFGLERSGDGLRLKEFRAAFPGSTRVEATGFFPSATDPAAFEGDVVLRGANLGRFLSWAGWAAPATEARSDGAFSLRSLLVTTSQSVSFRDITADLAGTVLAGSFQDDWSKRRRVDVQLEGSNIDLSNLAPGSLDFRAWRNVLHKSKTSTDEPPSNPKSSDVARATLPHFLQRWLDPAEGDLNVQIRAGRLIEGGQDLRDVSITASMKDGRLALSNLHFQSAASQTVTGQSGSGLDVEAEGEVNDLNGQPTGEMRGWVTAQDGAAVTQLANLLGLSIDTIGPDQARLLAPSRIAWTARFGNGRNGIDSSFTQSAANIPATASTSSAPGASANAPPTAVNLTLDGALLGRRFMSVLRLDGGLDNWRNAPIDGTLTLDGPDYPRLVQLLKLDEFAIGPTLPIASVAESKPDTFGQGRLSAKIVGRTASDILGDLRFNDDGLDWSFAGRASILAEGQLSAEGEIRISAADLERSLAQAGLGRNASLANVVVDGSADLLIKEGAIRLASRGLTLNGSSLLGDLTLSPAASNGVRRLEARLSTTDASIPRLLDLLLDPRGAKLDPKTDIAWSKTPFDLMRLRRIDGQIRLETKQLLLAKGLALRDATIDAKISNGRIDVTALDGLAAGGRLTSKWSLAPSKTGSIVAGSMTLSGSQLQQLIDLQQLNQLGTQSTGLLDASITLSGQGASPAAAIATLAGSGMLELTNGKIVGNTPTTVLATINGVMAGKIDLASEAIERALQQAAATGTLPMEKRKLNLTVTDGVVSVGALTIATQHGRTTNRTSMDLANFKYDVEWQIDVATPTNAAASSVPIEPHPAWPRVTVVHLGHLGEPELTVQRISAQTLARDLAVRKMERDVADLEQLRRQDEERLKVETERLKANDSAISNGSTVLPPTPTEIDNLNDDAKRRAAALRAIEARRPQPATRKIDAPRIGPSP
jgi:uncharacterized protein involved in outer membrane biogenesis